MTASAPDPKRRALGKGLESLLPQRTAPTPPLPAPSPAESTGKPIEIPLDQIERNPFQTRTAFDDSKLAELASSIASSGVVQPIVVRALTAENGSSPRYQLITGERRWLASRRAGKSTVPAIIRQVADEQALEMTIIENLQRADLNPIEQAKAYQRLSLQFKMTQEQVATRTGAQRATVANFLRLLKLPEPIQAKVQSGELSFGHARTLLALDSPESITSAAQKVIALSMSVRQTETYVQGLLNPEVKEKKEPKQAQDPNVREAQDLLQRHLGLKIHIEDKNGKGRVIINYNNLNDFDSILNALGGSRPE